MHGRLTIFLAVALVVLLLVGLNAASYVRLEEEVDSEFAPDRSTSHAGATGTLAFYEFLRESDYKVVRWRQPISELIGADKPGRPSVFVVVGELQRGFTNEESQILHGWVHSGGRLVVIDRTPDGDLLPRMKVWRISSELVEYPDMNTRPDDAEQMTEGVKPLAPAQPTLLTRDVEAVSRSRFASRLHVNTAAPETSPTPPGVSQEDEAEATEDSPSSFPAETDEMNAVKAEGGDSSGAPVEHLGDGRAGAGALLLDYAYGAGRVTVLSDPFIVSNVGVSRADNLQLATNIVAQISGGIIAFDEYHQGRGATSNQTLDYFKGTPAVALAAQLALVVLAVVWTRGRRFARPLPAPHTDRRSNLEFVASMAELQQRARAHDLAVENIYARTRRALARYGGTDANAPRAHVAERAAARSGRDAAEIETLMRECEDAIAGEHTSAHKALRLVARLRELERALGIRMRSREERQAKSF